MCTLFTEKGTFVKETSNVDGTDQTVTLANASLTPKVLWLWTENGTTANTYTDGYQVSYGFSDGTNDACTSASANDNDGDETTGGIVRDDAVCCILAMVPSGTPGINAQADVVSFNAGNFVLNWAVSDAVASIIHYMVVGGTDITNVKVTSHAVPAAASTGNESYTGVGFQGDFINILGGAEGQSANTVTNDWNFSIGSATSSSSRWVMGGSSEDAASITDTYNYKEITAIQAAWLETTAGDELIGDFVSFDIDGFTFNYSVESITATVPFASLVIKGGTWDLGNGVAPAATGQQTVTLASGGDPSAVMLFTWGDTTTSSAGTGEAENRISIGGGDDSLNEGCVSTHDTDNQNISISTKISRNDKIIRTHTANATAASSTTVAEADLVDMNNAGNFIIDWTTTLNGMGYVWFTVSPAAAPPAAADDVHRMGINTIPGNFVPWTMEDLVTQISTGGTNIRTFPLTKLRSSLPDTKSWLHLYVKQFLPYSYSSPDMEQLPHHHHGTIGQIQRTLDKSGLRKPMGVLPSFRHTLPFPIVRYF